MNKRKALELIKRYKDRNDTILIEINTFIDDLLGILRHNSWQKGHLYYNLSTVIGLVKKEINNSRDSYSLRIQEERRLWLERDNIRLEEIEKIRNEKDKEISKLEERLGNLSNYIIALETIGDAK
jgi:hypothetical protein